MSNQNGKLRLSDTVLKVLLAILIVVFAISMFFVFNPLMPSPEPPSDPTANMVMQHDSMDESQPEIPSDVFDPSNIKTIKKSGNGDDVISIEVTDAWFYKCRFEHKGESNFVVYCNDDLRINDIGEFTGDFFISAFPGVPTEFEVKADSSWLLDVVPLQYQRTAAFSGSGMSVSGVFGIPENTSFDIRHSGDSNFVVYFISADGASLIVNEIGSYRGTVKIDAPSSSDGFWAVEADGSWSITQPK